MYHKQIRGAFTLSAGVISLILVTVLTPAFGAGVSARSSTGTLAQAGTIVETADKDVARVGYTLQITPSVAIAKTVDKDVAYVGDTLHYTIGFTFTEGPSPTVRVAFTDTIPAYTEYVPGSVVGAYFTDTITFTGVYTNVTLWKNPVPPSEAAHWVTFDVRIVGFPPTGQIVNVAYIRDYMWPIPSGSLPPAWNDAITSVRMRLFLPIIFKAPLQ